MKKLLFQSGVLLLLLALMSTGNAQRVGEEVFEVNRFNHVFCDQGQSIQHAVDRAMSGSTAGSTVVMMVYGTCEESVLIRRGNLNILGRGEEPTMKPPAGTPAFRVENSENVFICCLNISGGSSGVEIANGSSAFIHTNIITGANIGIFVKDNSQALLYKNQVMGSGNSGIFISGSSQANLDENKSTGNILDGLTVVESSSASLSKNKFNGNITYGVRVQTNSTVSFADSNEMKNNGAFGVNCDPSAALVTGPAQVFGGNLGPVEIITAIHPPCWIQGPSLP